MVAAAPQHDSRIPAAASRHRYLSPVSELTWWPAPAKLNLFLHVTGRRQDGYHDLQTLFQLIDRCDQIGLAVREDDSIEGCAGLPEGAPEEDRVEKGALALQRHTGVGRGADIQV